MSPERGAAAVVLVVVVAVVVVAVGAVSVDLWRVLEAQRRLSGHVDAAATAAAAMVDETSLRSHGVAEIDASAARERACEMLVAAGAVKSCRGLDTLIDVAETEVSVEVTQRVYLGLLGRVSLEGAAHVDVVAGAVARLHRVVAPISP